MSALLVLGVLAGSGVFVTNALGARDRVDGLVDRIELALDPPPRRPARRTVAVTPRPTLAAAVPGTSIEDDDEPSATPARAERQETEAAAPEASPSPRARTPNATREPTPSPTATPTEAPVDFDIVEDHQAVFASQVTNESCAVAGTQIALAILGLADNSDEFQRELAGRIDEWESWEDSHNGGWGPAAIADALAAYGADDYEIRAYESREEALRGSAVALSKTRKPVVLLTWRGAHTWVMSGYRADANPVLFEDARIRGAYILDPWYPRVSSIWGPSDPPGNFEDTAELERNFLPWERPEGLYPERDGKFIVVVPTTRERASD